MKTAKRPVKSNIPFPHHGQIIGDDSFELGYSKEHGFLVQVGNSRWAKPITIDKALRLISRTFKGNGGIKKAYHAALDRAGVARA